ncbi:MAG TPA: hypothetical protein DCW68_03250 [Rhodospirillaceae bacterium]|nr:MAG: hypothetical protein A2018_06225 [Alphaproteobacteria bacterium GWF2_58_20]HAU29109.1 hypothetical protein [Rhodospirillaceae bacterium]
MSVSLPPIKSFQQQPQAGGGEPPLGTAMLMEVPERLQNIPHSITLSAYIISIENEVTRARVSAGDILMRSSVSLLKGKPLLIQLAPGTPPTFAVLFAISRVGASHQDSPLAPPSSKAAESSPHTGQTTPGTPSFATSGLGALLEVQENTPPETESPRDVRPLAEEPQKSNLELDT